MGNNIEKIVKIFNEKPAVRRHLVDALEEVYRNVGEPVLESGAVIDALKQATKPSRDAGGAPGSAERELYDHYGWPY